MGWVGIRPSTAKAELPEHDFLVRFLSGDDLEVSTLPATSMLSKGTGQEHMFAEVLLHGRLGN